jgi:hypothetical protein
LGTNLLLIADLCGDCKRKKAELSSDKQKSTGELFGCAANKWAQLKRRLWCRSLPLQSVLAGSPFWLVDAFVQLPLAWREGSGLSASRLHGSCASYEPQSPAYLHAKEKRSSPVRVAKLVFALNSRQSLASSPPRAPLLTSGLLVTRGIAQ